MGHHNSHPPRVKFNAPAAPTPRNRYLHVSAPLFTQMVNGTVRTFVAKGTTYRRTGQKLTGRQKREIKHRKELRRRIRGFQDAQP